MKKASKKKTAKKAVKKSAKKAKSSKKTATSAPKKAAKKTAKKKKVVKSAKVGAIKTAKSAKRSVKKVAAKKRPAKKAATPRQKKTPAPPPELPLGARAAPLPAPSITPAEPAEILLALAKILLDNAEYLDEVRLAAESPEAYVADFAADLDNRGIDGPIPELPWIALTDGLRRHGALEYLDWKFEPSDLEAGLETLLAGRREKVDLSGMSGYGESTDALQAVGDRLLAAGLALVTVDNNKVEDAFPIAILPNVQVAEAQHLAEELGLGMIQRWSSEDKFA